MPYPGCQGDYCTLCGLDRGYWGLDCGLSAARLRQQQLRAALRVRPRVYMYEVPASIRRSCAPWSLPEDFGDRLLLSDHREPDPSKADLFWIYGCPNGDTILPMLSWIKGRFPFWNASVAGNVPRHAIAVGHEEGWSEVTRSGCSSARWLGPNFDHANRNQRPAPPCGADYFHNYHSYSGPPRVFCLGHHSRFIKGARGQIRG